MTLSKADILSALKTFFREKADQFKVQVVFLYGSYAHGNPRKDSDVDVAVVFDTDLPEDDALRQINTISIELTKLLGLDVNVLTIFKDFRKPMLYYNAVVKGIPIFIKEVASYTYLRNEAISRMEDFQLFGTRWQFEAAKRNLSHG
jgi:predicted nucleotidyltransferase